MNTQTVTQPENPIKAVTAPDPYPYYRELVRQKPFYYDETLRMWVAASAEAVRSVLGSELCRVRPPAEPVPKALLDSRAGDIFGRLVRMIDGPGHRELKQAVSAVLTGIDKNHFEASCQKWAKGLFDQRFDSLSGYVFQLPVYVMADLLGIPNDQLGAVAEWVSNFVHGISPLSGPAEFERGKAASQQLWDHAEALLASQRDRQVDGLFAALAAGTGCVGPESSESIVANGVGFLSQAYEATAGLIGNTIVSLARQPDILRRVKADLEVLPEVVREVARYDASIQNTRRYVAEDGSVAGHRVKAGDTILVILAAANHDPAVNPTPERFEICRQDRQIFTFGFGVHACPGQKLAVGIASTGVKQLIAAQVNLSRLSEGFSYQDSVNARIPIFMSTTRSSIA